MNTKFLAGAGFLYGKASLTAAIPCDMTRGTLSFFLITFYKRRLYGLYAFLHLILSAEMPQLQIPNVDVTCKYYMWSRS
jgi:hypothetical protein